MAWEYGGSKEYERRMNATDFGTRFTTSTGRTGSGEAAVPQAWQWFLVSGTLYYLRHRQSAGALFRITKTVLKATTYVTGSWCVVDLAAVLGASNMSWLYDGSDGVMWSSSEQNGMWRESYNLQHTRTRINNLFKDLTVLSAVGACCYESWLQLVRMK